MISIILDTETTGLPNPSFTTLDRQPHIIEIAMIKLEDGERVDDYSQLINPGIKLPDVITKITGLLDDDLEGAPSWIEVHDTVARFFQGADQFIAHNASFDKSLIEFELKRLHMEWEPGEQVWEPGGGSYTTESPPIPFPWPKETVCTAQEFTHLFGYRPKMTQLYEEILGKKLEQTHRAMDDCNALLEILDRFKYWGE